MQQMARKLPKAEVGGAIQRNRSDPDAVNSAKLSNFYAICQVASSLSVSFHALRALLTIADKKSTDHFTQLFLFLRMTNADTPSLQTIAVQEIMDSNDATYLFRSDSLITRLAKEFTHSIGTAYLNNSVIGLMRWTIDQRFIGSLNFEVLSSQDSCGDGEPPESSFSAETTHQKVVLAVDVFINYIVGSLHTLSPKIKHFFSLVIPTIQVRFGTTSKRRFLVTFFFLRYLCPVLACPPDYFFKLSFYRKSATDESKMRRFLIVISKILQRIANGTAFTTGHMAFANYLVAKYSTHLSLICQHLCYDNDVHHVDGALLRRGRLVFDCWSENYYANVIENLNDDGGVKLSQHWPACIRSVEELLQHELEIQEMIRNCGSIGAAAAEQSCFLLKKLKDTIQTQM